MSLARLFLLLKHGIYSVTNIVYMKITTPIRIIDYL